MKRERFSFASDVCEFVNRHGIKKENIIAITCDGSSYMLFYVA